MARRKNGFSRRSLLRGGVSAATLAALGLTPQEAHAAPKERKFLFFFASGGWDTTTVFDPHFDTDGVDMDPDTWVGEAGNLRFTAGDDRPAVERFFRRWRSRAAIVNGVNAHSVGHESAAQFVLTGTSASSYPDWPTLLAARASGDYPLPHVVFSGPSFPGTSGAAVVRAGGGTLLDLIDGSISGQADVSAPVLPPPADTMIDAVVHRRTAELLGQREGLGAERAESMLSNLERSMELEGRRFEAGLSELGRSLLEQSIKATELMRLGLTRCAMIGIPSGWDSHGNIAVQAPRFDAFFEALDELMEHMAITPGRSTPWLIDEVVIVTLSEFGRTPRLNGSGGKDHWPFGSAMFVGSGVAGNRMVGATDDSLIARPVDLSTGLPSESGMELACEHIGTTLMRLGGLDPNDHLPGVEVVEALLA